MLARSLNRGELHQVRSYFDCVSASVEQKVCAYRTYLDEEIAPSTHARRRPLTLGCHRRRQGSQMQRTMSASHITAHISHAPLCPMQPPGSTSFSSTPLEVEAPTPSPDDQRTRASRLRTGGRGGHDLDRDS
ncbi:hypothetical protein ACHAWF_014757 [Thalassiosira exigua]